MKIDDASLALWRSTPGNSTKPQVSWNHTSDELLQSSTCKHRSQIEEAPAAVSLQRRSRTGFARVLVDSSRPAPAF